jgi:hypothetical protein
MDDGVVQYLPSVVYSSSFPRNAARALDPFRERRLASTSEEFVSDVERLCEVVVVADVSNLFVIWVYFFYPVRWLSFTASEIRLSYT